MVASFRSSACVSDAWISLPPQCGKGVVDIITDVMVMYLLVMNSLWRICGEFTVCGYGELIELYFLSNLDYRFSSLASQCCFGNIPSTPSFMWIVLFQPLYVLLQTPFDISCSLVTLAHKSFSHSHNMSIP